MTGDRILVADVASLALGAEMDRSASRSAALHFSVDHDGRTHISTQFAPYPFHFCRPFYLPGDPPGMATVYVQSCAGGIFEHDRLGLNIEAQSGSKAHVTTSASTIVHSMPGGDAKQSVTIFADTDSLVEYLPDPMILFAGARINATLNVVVNDGAHVILSDAFLMHDPKDRGGAFDGLRSEIVVRGGNDKVLARDRFHVDGRSVQARVPGVTGRFMAQASFMCLAGGISSELLSSLRAALDCIEDVYAGVSLLPAGAGIFSRILAADGISLRTAQLCLWSEARKYLTGVAPTPRRK